MTRPYSDLELVDLNNDIDSKYRLSSIKAFHVPCMHTYAVKKGGKKEEFVSFNKQPLDELTCSVCFKLRTSIVSDAIDKFIRDVCYDNTDDRSLDIDYLRNKESFYRWLYQHDY